MSPDELPEHLRACCEALDEKKAEDITVLHFGPGGPVADDFIVATGTSEPHLRALVKSVEACLDKQGMEYVSARSGLRSGWMVIDAYDLLVHVFTKDTRRYFNLEGLWKDARRVDFVPEAPAVRG
ncbi:MAG: ribosome silencing factor [Opitutales bacterium]|nr:ribosome silencing factor [Opitutales bacterium]